MKNKILQLIKISLITTICFSFSSAFAWTDPTSIPPSGNTTGPININGSVAQAKGGTIAIGALFNVNGLLSSLGLGVIGSSTSPGNAIITGSLKINSLNKANNPTISSWPAPICIDSVGTLILCANLPPSTYLLTITNIGTGSGTVAVNDTTASLGLGNCTSSCLYQVPSGHVINLSATAAAGSTFTSWGGICSNGTCTTNITMNAPQSVTATFTANGVGGCSVTTMTPAVNITSSNAVVGGNVTDDGGANISLGARGVEYGTTTSYGATAADYSASGTGAYTVQLSGLSTGATYHYRAYAINDANLSCNGDDATFTTSSTATKYTLTVARTGTGTGAITSSPAGVSCGGGGSICNYDFNANTNVTLTETPSSYNTFAGWSGGGCTGTNSTCVVSMTAAKTIMASFTAPLYPSVTTSSASGVATTTAITGGNVTSDGGAPVTIRGVVYWPTNSPTSTQSISGGTGTGTFTINLSGLIPATSYSVKAFATNITGTSYGSVITFTTSTAIPSVNTLSVSSIGSASAVGNGYVVTNGTTVTERGVVWGRVPGPRTWDNCVSGVCNKNMISASGGGNIALSMSKDMPYGLSYSLAPNTTYYVRAYAIAPGLSVQDPLNPSNTSDHIYGNQVTFTTALPSCVSGSFSQGTQGSYSFSTSSISNFPCSGILTVKIWGGGGGGGGGAGATGNYPSGESFGAGGGGGGEGGYVKFQIPLTATSMTFSGSVGAGGSGGAAGAAGEHNGSGGGSGGTTTLTGPNGINISALGGSYGNPGTWGWTTQFVPVKGTGGAGGSTTGASSIPGAISGSVVATAGTTGNDGSANGSTCNGDGGHAGSLSSGGAGGPSGGTKQGGCGANGAGGDGGESGINNMVGGGGGGGGGAMGGYHWILGILVPEPYGGGSGGLGHSGKVNLSW